MDSGKNNAEILQASHALLIDKRGGILLQHKDDKAKILNPGKVSMFGGGLERNESEIGGLKRELFEELGLKLDEHQFYKLGDYSKTKELDTVDRQVHVYVVKNVDAKDLVLTEGQAILSDTADKYLANTKLTRITRLALEDYLKFIK